MGRHARRLRRVRGVSKKQAQSGKVEKEGQNDPSSVDIHGEKFFQDEIDEFHETKEKLLLEGHGNSSGDDGLSGDEEEVMGWSESGEEEEEEFQLPPSLRRQFYASDEEEMGEEQQQKNETSEKAWGRKKKTFYAMEGEDELSGSEGSEMAAELEEKEAIALQQRMAAALKDSDFLAPSYPVADGSESREREGMQQEQVVRDLSKLSRKDKLALLEKDSPELFDLLEDFESCLSEAVHVLHPLVTVARDTPTVTKEGKEYLETKFSLNLIYCMNIMFYLYLQASKVPVKSHPVIQRIIEIRQLIGRLEPIDEQLEKQMETLLKSAESLEQGEKGTRDEEETLTHSASNQRERSQRKLPVKPRDETEKLKGREKQKENESSSSKEGMADEGHLVYYERVAEEKKKMKKRKREEREKRKIGTEEKGEMEEEEVDEDGKRAVTYQISRNRGLIPQRKKELRNPRVKHRNKYRKALIKRKGQVRAVVAELNRYGGETSGIRANVSHSIKIK